MNIIPNTVLALLVLGIFSCTQAQEKSSNESLTPKTMTVEQATKLVKPFYDFLGGDATPEEVQPSYHSDWISYFDNESGRNMQETVGFVSGPVAQMVPNLKWAIKGVYVTAENTIIVRGEATGTPAGENFMGTPIPGGKSFKFMSIDIHELKGDKIIKTYHVEDWLSAIQQVASN